MSDTTPKDTLVSDDILSTADMTAPLTKCKQQVYSRVGFPRPHQCRITAWKDGYCKIHHPDSARARNEKQKLRWEAERERKFADLSTAKAN